MHADGKLEGTGLFCYNIDEAPWELPRIYVSQPMVNLCCMLFGLKSQTLSLVLHTRTCCPTLRDLTSDGAIAKTQHCWVLKSDSTCV